MEFNLKQILKALLFSTSESLAIKDVQAVITRYHLSREDDEETDSIEEEQGVFDEVLSQVPNMLTATQIREAFAEIEQELIDRREPYRVLEGVNGFRLTISPDYADWIRLMRNEPRPQRLSSAAMETLAIVAYRQPVTRAEIEAIRGVSSDSGLSKLLDKDLIVVLGRADLPGRPLQYGTTSQFLEFCGLKSLEELPASDVISPQQISEWIRRATMPEEAATETTVGLAPADINP